MSKEATNKAIVAEWFKKFWGNPADLSVVDKLGTPDILFQYPMHGPIRGRENLKAMMFEMREAFPDLNFWAVGDPIAEGDYVAARWDGGGTPTAGFRPDFWLPDRGIFIELTTADQRLVTRKNGQVRRMRELYPEVPVVVVYQRDFLALLESHGLDLHVPSAA